MTARRFVLGILGPVASGKTHVARRAAVLGQGQVLEADRLAHEALDLAARDGRLRALFGPGVVTGCQANRDALRARVHADPAVLKALEGLTHPYVRARLEAAVAAQRRGEGAPLLVLDVPLLLEAHLEVLCDELWYIEVPEALRRQRAQARGVSPEDLARWEQAQESALAKRARASRTIRNDVSPAELDLQIREALAQPTPA